jgi:hypothetical protein
LFTAIYRSQRDHRPVQFPLDAERGSEEFDGRLAIGFRVVVASSLNF